MASLSLSCPVAATTTTTTGVPTTTTTTTGAPTTTTTTTILGTTTTTTAAPTTTTTTTAAPTTTTTTTGAPTTTTTTTGAPTTTTTTTTVFSCSTWDLTGGTGGGTDWQYIPCGDSVPTDLHINAGDAVSGICADDSFGMVKIAGNGLKGNTGDCTPTTTTTTTSAPTTTTTTTGLPINVTNVSSDSYLDLSDYYVEAFVTVDSPVLAYTLFSVNVVTVALGTVNFQVEIFNGDTTGTGKVNAGATDPNGTVSQCIVSCDNPSVGLGIFAC